MSQPVTAYFTALVAFLAIDYVWLAFLARDFYRRQLGELMLDNPKLGIAAGFYLVYALAIVALAVMPALRANDWTLALIYGALLGFAAYGTYDITNLATIKGWPTMMAVVDMAWGTVLTGAAAVIAFIATRWIAAA